MFLSFCVFLAHVWGYGIVLVLYSSNLGTRLNLHGGKAMDCLLRRFVAVADDDLAGRIVEDAQGNDLVPLYFTR